MPLPKEATAPTISLSFQPVEKSGGERILLYGPTKIGKTSLATKMPGKTVFIDLDESLGKLKGTDNLLTLPAKTFDEVYGSLNNAEMWEGIDNIVIDSMTVLHVLATNKVLQEFKKSALEDFGWGKGNRHVFNNLDKILQSLENHKRAGRNVCAICHTQTGYKPNASGEDFLFYSPDLMETSKFSFKERMKAWADHILFINYDISVTEGKAEGNGSRSIHTKEMPYMTAGSRTIDQAVIPYTEGSDQLWRLVFPNKYNNSGAAAQKGQ